MDADKLDNLDEMEIFLPIHKLLKLTQEDIDNLNRVIRSEEDRGVAILIDERFTYSKYLELMPRHWQNKKIITNAYGLKNEILKFYNKT